MFKNLLITLILAYILGFLETQCASVTIPRARPAGRQLEFPDNEIPLTPPRAPPRLPPRLPPRAPPRTEGIISTIINFFKNLLGVKSRRHGFGGSDGDGGDGEFEFVDGGYGGSEGIFSFIRNGVSSLISSLIRRFGGSSEQTPEANFPYNRVEPYRKMKS